MDEPYDWLETREVMRFTPLKLDFLGDENYCTIDAGADFTFTDDYEVTFTMADATLILKILDAQLAIRNASADAHLTIALDVLEEAGLTDDDISRLEDAGVHVVAHITEEPADEVPSDG